MPVTEIKAIRSVTVSQTLTTRQYEVTYRVTMSGDQSDPKEVLDGLPFKILDDNWYYVYESNNDKEALVYEIGTPRRELGNKSKNIWQVQVGYLFDADQWPEYIPMKIVPSYVYENRTVKSSLFQGWYKLNTDLFLYEKQPDEDFNKLPEDENLLKPFSQDPAKATRGPITNSGGIPLVPAPTERISVSRLRVTWTRYFYLNTDFFINRVNSELINLTAYDRPFAPSIQHRGDQPRPIFNQTYQPGTLLFSDVQVTSVYLMGRNCYEYSIDFIVKPDHFRYELDQGISSRSGVDEPNGSGSRWGDPDVQEEQPELMRFKYLDGTPVTEPVLMDGKGKPIIPANPTDSIYLAWQIFPSVDFNILQIGDPGSRGVTPPIIPQTL